MDKIYAVIGGLIALVFGALLALLEIKNNQILNLKAKGKKNKDKEELSEVNRKLTDNEALLDRLRKEYEKLTNRKPPNS